MHKTKLFLVCGSCLALTGTRGAWAEAFDESKGFMFHARAHPIRKIIVPPSRELLVDEAIIALSKASDNNFIADATQIPAEMRVAPFPVTPAARKRNWKAQFFNVVGDMQEAAQLSQLLYNATTHLLWKRPNALETARALLAAGKLRPSQPLPQQADLLRILDDLRNDPLVKPRIAPNGDIRVGDIPPEPRKPIMEFARYALLRPQYQRELLLSDPFWKTARVLFVPAEQVRDFGKNATLVFVSGQDEDGKATPLFRPFLSSWHESGLLQVLGGHPANLAYPVALADLKTPPVTSESAPVVIDLTAAKELEAQAPLQAPISLEVKRRPLSVVLTQASQQSGVALSQTGDASEVLVTARVEKMPLHELMGALARLSGAMWQKSATGFELQAQPLEPWQKLLLRSGKGDFEGYGAESQFTPEELQPLSDLEQAIVDEIGDQQTPEGVPISLLSEDLQAQLKQTIQVAAANSLVVAFRKAYVFASSEALLHFSGNRSAGAVILLKADGYDSMFRVQLNGPPLPPEEQPTIPAEPTDDAAPAPDAP